MNKYIVICLILLLSFLANAEQNEAKQIQWVDLMPAEDMNALYNPPDELLDIPEGGAEDDISNQVYTTLMQAEDSDYLSALTSKKVVDELNNQRIEIPGYIVPVTIEGDKTTEFFIVPYFGACIHYPPPPPNQTIFSDYKKGFSLEKIYEPYFFTGLLTTSIKENELATAAYHLAIDDIAVYEER